MPQAAHSSACLLGVSFRKRCVFCLVVSSCWHGQGRLALRESMIMSHRLDAALYADGSLDLATSCCDDLECEAIMSPPAGGSTILARSWGKYPLYSVSEIPKRLSCMRGTSNLLLAQASVNELARWRVARTLVSSTSTACHEDRSCLAFCTVMHEYQPCKC